MKNATVMNDVQKIQRVLEEYIGNRKAARVAVEISAVIQGETQHTRRGEVFFVHKDDSGKLVLTMESEAKENVQAILNSYLKEDEAQECIKQLMTENCETKATEFETIKIPGSDSPIYAKLLKHKPVNDAEVKFMTALHKAISKSVKEFEVFVNDPSIYNGKLQFVPGFRPAVGYTYKEWEKLAKKNGLRLGTKDEYIMFLGWLINSLINEGWTVSAAWNSVCTDSKKLGHYHDSKDAKDGFEVTGSRKVAGKCDLANVYKILAEDKEAGGIWVASSNYYFNSQKYPLADLFLSKSYVAPASNSVGWLVR